MMLGACVREKEVAELLRCGHWPQASPAELRAHVDSCRACGDLVLVTQTLQKARTQASGAARLETAGVLWWRAQLRRRNAAIERIGKPILGAQIFALAVNFLVVAGLLISQARHGLNWLSWLEELPQASTLHLEVLWPSALFSPGWSLMLMIPVLATLALLGGVVVYLASEKQ
jgi:hypothetical protein